jgi:hypothetical protein
MKRKGETTKKRKKGERTSSASIGTLAPFLNSTLCTAGSNLKAGYISLTYCSTVIVFSGPFPPLTSSLMPFAAASATSFAVGLGVFFFDLSLTVILWSREGWPKDLMMKGRASMLWMARRQYERGRKRAERREEEGKEGKGRKRRTRRTGEEP